MKISPYLVLLVTGFAIMFSCNTGNSKVSTVILESKYMEGRFFKITPDEEILEKVEKAEKKVLDSGGGPIPDVYIVSLKDIFPYTVVNPLTAHKEGATEEGKTFTEVSLELTKKCGGEILEICRWQKSFKLHCSIEQKECLENHELVQSIEDYRNFRLTPF